MDTPVLDAINTLCNCAANNDDEKLAFEESRRAYVKMKRLGKMEPEDFLPDQKRRSGIKRLLGHCIAVFEKDAKARGYIPPIQRLHPDGTVAQTFTIDNDGTESVSEGGSIGFLLEHLSRTQRSRRRI